jgi:hypothetical protein
LNVLPPAYPPIDLLFQFLASHESESSVSSTAATFGPIFYHGQSMNIQLSVLTDLQSGFMLSDIKNGCELYSVDEAKHVFGNFVAVKRGGCVFETKAEFAQIAGASGILILSSNSHKLAMSPSKVYLGADNIIIPAMFSSKLDTEKLIKNMSPLRSMNVYITAVDTDLHYIAEQNMVSSENLIINGKRNDK